MRSLLAILCLVGFVLAPASARAHVANLSQSDFTVDGANVHALVVFAKPDAVRLGEMDPDQDGIVTPAELEASQGVFRDLVKSEMTVSADGARCTPTLEGGGDVEGDGFGLSIALACASPVHELTVSMDLLRRLLPGHRHMLHLHAGDVTIDAVLTSEEPRVDLDVSPTAGAPASKPPSALGAAVRMGIEHILTGWDHLLFLLALLLGTRGVRQLALAVSAFTVAHSITLALAALGVVTLSARVVEPAIAASIAYVAFETAWRPDAGHRWRLAFVFGLVHGFGFAGALKGLALARDRLLPTLFGFNLGVEMGQLLVLAVFVPALVFALRRSGSDEGRVVRAASIVVGAVGLAVFVARVAGGS